MAMNLGTLTAYLSADTKNFDDAIGGSEAKVKGFAGAAPGWMGVAAAGIIAGGVAAGAGLYQLGGSFDDLEDGIRIATGATGEALDGLVASAKNVGTQVPVEFSKIGPALADVHRRTGLTGTALEEVTAKFLEAGRVLNEEIDVNAATGALTAFGVPAEEMSGKLDLIFQAAQRSGVGMNDMIGRISAAAPAAQGLGFSLEETAGMIGTLDKAGIDSGSMMAGMGKGLIALAKDGEEPREAFRRVVGEMQTMMEQGDTTGARLKAAEVFGTRNANQFIQALETGAMNLDDLAAAGELSGDSIMGAGADTMDFAEKWQLFVNETMLKLEPIATRVFNGLGGLLESILPVAEGAFSWVSENIPLLTTLGVILGSFAVAWGLVTAAVAVYNVVMGVMRAVTLAGSVAQWAMNVAMAANPIGLIILAVTALIAIIVLLVMNWDQVVAFITDVWGGFIGWITDGLNGFFGWWNGVWAGFASWIGDLWDGMVSGIEDIWQGFISWITNLILTFIVGWIRMWNGVGRFFSDLWGGIIGGISGAWNGVMGFLRGIPGQIMGFFAGIGSWLWNAGVDLVNGLMNGIRSMASGIGRFFLNLLPGWIVEPFKLALGIKSPSRLFAGYGRNTVEGYLQGVESMKPDLAASMAHLVPAPGNGAFGAEAGADGLSGGHSGRGRGDVNFYGNVGWDPDEVARKIREEDRRQAVLSGIDELVVVA